ncbi:sugar isomerase domain-containing protein [Kineosporia sp. J2-2]|uniref:Sugar isomerase domain-containing protein n=1 Tax=Kineosporia corallincola TaxID=2835133 RepID=A0ABS5TC27_9ACTN|nr:sugar isomerase domain-containing protein [Kineosporia corallincola]MBT0768634.1 sugar isomerase domain-containing protein [Kineosporia corallincola]
MPALPLSTSVRDLEREVSTRLADIADDAAGGALEPAVGLLAGAIRAGGVVQAFGTGHSEAFAMEIAGRAGGLIPTNKVALRNVVLHGEHTVAELAGDPPLERDPRIADDLFATIVRDPADVFVIASNSGVNGSVVGLALLAQQHGHQVVAVTSLLHTARVTPKHPSGKRLSEIADVVIDNRAPYGDATLQGPGGVGVGAVSSITSAFIAQLLTIGVAEHLATAETPAPLYLSANIPGGDEHNRTLEARYGERILRYA